MFSNLALSALAVTSALVAPAPQDAREILDTARQMQAARLAGVENYTVDQTMSGNRVLLYYERIPDTDLFRMVPVTEIAREESGYAEGEPQQMAAGMAMGLRMLGPALTREMPAGSGALAMDDMMGDMILFMEGASSVEEDDGEADAEAAAHDLRTFANVARVVGRETVDGVECFQLRADDLGLGQMTEDGHVFELHSVSVWFDTEYYLPRRLLMTGTLTTDGNSSSLSIEKLDQDYRVYGDMGGLGVFSPKRQTMRLTGLMGGLSDKEQREIEEAKVKLAEFDRQLAAMPESQKQMIESRMGGQLEQMRKLVAGGALETVVVVNDVKVNDGPPSGLEMGKAITSPSP